MLQSGRELKVFLRNKIGSELAYSGVGYKRKRGKESGKKKDKTKMIHYNCQKIGYLLT